MDDKDVNADNISFVMNDDIVICARMRRNGCLMHILCLLLNIPYKQQPTLNDKQLILATWLLT